MALALFLLFIPIVSAQSWPWNSYNDTNSSQISTSTCPICPCELVLSNGTLTCAFVQQFSQEGESKWGWTKWRGISINEHKAIASIDKEQSVTKLKKALKEKGFNVTNVEKFEDNPPPLPKEGAYYATRYPVFVGDGSVRYIYNLFQFGDPVRK